MSNCHPRENGDPDVSVSLNIWIPFFKGMTKTMYKEKKYFVYILSSQRNGTLYIGVTNNLIRRIYQHKHSSFEGFTKDYNIHQLVYYEEYNDVNTAISREKQMKKWNRKWKLEINEKNNLTWRDLYDELNPIF